MLPESNITIDFEISKQTNKTYKLDLENNRIVGYVDGLEAVKQSVMKVLETERYKYMIYSWNYGVELNNLIGKEKDFAKSEIKRRIVEALTVDERIMNISNFSVKTVGDIMYCTFIVNTTEGSFETSTIFQT